METETLKQLREAYDGWAFTTRVSPQRAEAEAPGLCQYIPLLLDEIERLRAELEQANGHLKGDWRPPGDNDPSGKIAELEYELKLARRPDPVDEQAMDIIRRAAALLKDSLPPASPSDPHAVASAKFGIGDFPRLCEEGDNPL